MINALVLAGSNGKSELEESVGVNNKSFIMINGEPLIAYILKVLTKMETIEQIGVVGPVQELTDLKENYDFKIIPQRGDIMDNLLSGINALPRSERVIVLSGDIPMVTKDGLEDFIASSGEMESDFYYSIISRDICQQRFPKVERTYVNTKDGSFTGGNVFLVNPEIVPAILPQVRKLLDNRKHPLKMASLLGIGLLWGILTKSISVSAAEIQVSKILGISIRAVVSPYAELGTDVDKISDLKLAEEELGEINLSDTV